jgi:hypothetical protein
MLRLDIAAKGTMELADGFLRLRWRAGETIGADEARTALEVIDVLGRGASLPMLVHVQGVSFSRAARRSFLHLRAFPGSRSWGHPRWIMLSPFSFCG